MKTIKHLIFSALLACIAANSLYAQENTHQKAYLGVGTGFDYGGFGLKVEILPIKHVGVFGGLGYNLLSLGWNLGGTFKILPDSKVSPNLMLMYGYNGVFKGTDKYSEKYNMTSYGLTTGVNLDIKLGNKGHKLSCGLFLPFRSGKFQDNYDAAKNDPNMKVSDLPPVAFSIGFNFAL
ncbi:MAG: hypothetical protein FWC39_00020 [Bacteroidetes bacterium]|nr:hypothetical protein [Bacteroidota bacterium]